MLIEYSTLPWLITYRKLSIVGVCYCRNLKICLSNDNLIFPVIKILSVRLQVGLGKRTCWHAALCEEFLRHGRQSRSQSYQMWATVAVLTRTVHFLDTVALIFSVSVKFVYSAKRNSRLNREFLCMMHMWKQSHTERCMKNLKWNTWVLQFWVEKLLDVLLAKRVAKCYNS